MGHRDMGVNVIGYATFPTIMGQAYARWKLFFFYVSEVRRVAPAGVGLVGVAELTNIHFGGRWEMTDSKLILVQRFLYTPKCPVFRVC